MIVLVLTLTCWMELVSARTRERTQAQVRTCIKSVSYLWFQLTDFFDQMLSDNYVPIISGSQTQSQMVFG